MKAVLAFALAGAVAGSGGLAAALPAPVRVADWTRIISATPEGGFRMGNPAAAVKLVEYGSLTCPHCAHFTAEAAAPLRARVRSGKVSYEFRNYILNGIDVTASLVARCTPPQHFFALIEELYATQPTWVGRISGLPQEEKDKIRPLPTGERLVRLAEVGGLIPVATRHGLPAARAKQCLADKAGLDRLSAMADAAEARGVEGTPTFFINDQRIPGMTWAEIDAALKAAGG